MRGERARAKGGYGRGKRGGGGGEGGPEAALEEMGERFRRLATRERFEACWVRYCRKGFERSGEEVWGRVRGPYEM